MADYDVGSGAGLHELVSRPKTLYIRKRWLSLIREPSPKQVFLSLVMESSLNRESGIYMPPLEIVGAFF